ncbi:MAG: TolB family protein [Bacteroidia bacterium]
MKKYLFFLFQTLGMWSFAQNPDIYLIDIADNGEKYEVKYVLQLTQNKGYDNQPYFSPDGNSLYYSAKNVGELHTDIYRFDIKNRAITAVTSTPFESEFSPCMYDNKHISVVKVERDSSQRIWEYTISDYEKPHALLSRVKKIGYYAWITETEAATFIVGNPHKLVLNSMESGEKPVDIASDIGRTLHKVPNEKAVSYVQKSKTEPWKIMKWNMKGEKTEIITALEGVEDFAWTSKGNLICAKEGIVYRFNPKKDKEWVKVADLTVHGINHCGRIAIHPKDEKLAIVVEK